MAQLKRLVLHCTATPEGREVSAADIRHWHTDPVSKGGRGWKQVGYTDMIHLDGKVERLQDPQGHPYPGAEEGDGSLRERLPPAFPLHPGCRA